MGQLGTVINVVRSCTRCLTVGSYLYSNAEYICICIILSTPDAYFPYPYELCTMQDGKGHDVYFIKCTKRDTRYRTLIQSVSFTASVCYVLHISVHTNNYLYILRR